MTIRALRCRLAPPGSDPLDVVPWTGAAADLDGRRAAGVYVIVDDALPHLRHLPAIFTDRRRKHESRSLSSILL